eukprot:3377048-Pleurochrysis_carterae.AAC.4
MKTGLPRHLTVIQSPGFSLLISTSSCDRAITSADGFICARNLIRASRQALAPIRRAPPDSTPRKKRATRHQGQTEQETTHIARITTP